MSEDEIIEQIAVTIHVMQADGRVLICHRNCTKVSQPIVDRDGFLILSLSYFVKENICKKVETFTRVEYLLEEMIEIEDKKVTNRPTSH